MTSVISAVTAVLDGADLPRFFLIFCRIASALASAPAFGESYISVRGRLAFSVLCAFLLVPAASRLIPQAPAGEAAFFMAAAGETICGWLMGTCVRLFCSAVHAAGMVFASQSGLSAAMMFDPSQAASGSAPGVFLSMASVALIFSTGLDLVFLRALADSYFLVPAGGASAGEYAAAALECAARGFSLAVRLSMPFLAAGFLFHIVSGVTARMAPQMQVFFALAPLQLLIALAALAASFSALMLRFGEELEEILAGFSS